MVYVKTLYETLLYVRFTLSTSIIHPSANFFQSKRLSCKLVMWNGYKEISICIVSERSLVVDFQLKKKPQNINLAHEKR